MEDSYAPNYNDTINILPASCRKAQHEIAGPQLRTNVHSGKKLAKEHGTVTTVSSESIVFSVFPLVRESDYTKDPNEVNFLRQSRSSILN